MAKNATKIKITGHTLTNDRSLSIFCEKILWLRTARKVGDTENVNNTVLGRLNDNSLMVQFEKMPLE